MSIDTGAQLVGIIVGALAGLAIAAGIAGGRYRHVGGGWFELVEDPMSCLPGCLLQIVLTVVGAGAGYLIGSMVGG